LQKTIINILVGMVISLLLVVGIMGFFLNRERARADEYKARADKYSRISQGAEDALKRAEERYAEQQSKLGGAVEEVERLRAENGELRATIQSIRKELEGITAVVGGSISRIEKCEIIVDRIIRAIQSMLNRLG
jgi:chromosome segregation ATPase